MSDDDLTKLRRLENSIRNQLVRYAFTSFPPKDLTVFEDSDRPEKEGFEIGFEMSASDNIRLKWAYQLGLPDVASTLATNHPALVVFDEPRQQEAAETSVAGLLAEVEVHRPRGRADTDRNQRGLCQSKALRRQDEMPADRL